MGGMMDFQSNQLSITRTAALECESFVPAQPGSESVFTETGNPGTLGGATGAWKGNAPFEAASFKFEAYCKLADAATALIRAIADCDLAGASEIMATAYGDLRAGMPIAPFDGLMSEARIWAEFATSCESKAYCAATFAAMRAADQAAFLGYVPGIAA
jgi:hypothetical protein